MKNKLKRFFPLLVSIKKNMKIKKRIKESYNLFKTHWIDSKPTINKIGYKILLDAHSIEKGMTSKSARCFGVQKVHNIIKNIKIYEKESWNKDFAYNLGVSVLHEYCKFYKQNNWTEQLEYIETSKFIESRPQTIVSGVKNLSRADLTKNSKIDYDCFLDSRHSIRNYDRKKIATEDIIKAVDMAIKTPTACNRQMCKIYYVNTKGIREQILKYSHGLTNFDMDTVNILIVTYDISSLCNEGEIQQGMFNSGLVSMNLVNALHSLGIGSCFLEYSNCLAEEEEMKSIIGIPKNEKVAVVVAMGYYPDKAIIPCSTRKPREEVYREI